MSFRDLPAEWRIALLARSFTVADLRQLDRELDAALSAAPNTHAKVFAAPDRDLVFRAFHLTAPDKVQVVVLGQDPYPQAHPDPHPPRGGVADGLAFSSAGLWPQSSLTPLLWELRSSGLQSAPPCGADLEAWAGRGVLLLNASLIYSEAGVNARTRVLLQKFSRAVLAHCSTLADQPAFLILGGRAWAVAEPILRGLPAEQVVRTRHPSRPPWPGKADPDRPFVRLNDFLGARAVDWSIP